MIECYGCAGRMGEHIRDRQQLLRNLAVGDIFHATAPNGASLVCLTTAVTETTIQARTVTHQIHLDFDRETGVEWNAARDPSNVIGMSDQPALCVIDCVIDSVAPLPVDIYNVILFIDRKFRLENVWDRLKLSETEQQALFYVDPHYRAHPLPGAANAGLQRSAEAGVGDASKEPFRPSVLTDTT